MKRYGEIWRRFHQLEDKAMDWLGTTCHPRSTPQYAWHHTKDLTNHGTIHPTQQGQYKGHEKVSRIPGSATDSSFSPARIANMRPKTDYHSGFAWISRGENNWKKGFVGILGHELMKYLMFQYSKITEPITEQEKAESREDYDPRLMISTFFKRIEDVVQLSDDARFPWQPEQILQNSYG